jgi:cytochrome P450
MTWTAELTEPPSTLERFDPGWPELIVNPYPVYARYRDMDPVHWGLAANSRLRGAWYTFSWDECEQALSDPRLKSDPASVGMADVWPPAFEPIAHVFLEWLGAIDPPKHSRIRGVLAKTFTPRRIRDLIPRVEAVAARMLDDSLAAGQPFDLVSQYAFPLPMAVIGDMLGVPPADRAQFRKLSTQFARAIDKPGNEEFATAGSSAARYMLGYFKEQLEIRRKSPTDDLMTAMMQASTDDGQVMTESEVLATVIELIVAGHETTVSTVATGTYGMLAQGLWAEMAAEPARLSGAALEEILRWVSPVQRQRQRWVTEPMGLRGRQLAYGDSVVVVLGSANHDPERFPDPDHLHFDRPNVRHLTFGHGPHMCLGAALARMEVGVGMRAMLGKAPDLRLAEDVQWRQNSFLPGPSRLLVERGQG